MKPICVCLFVVGCTTELVVENSVPGATLENVRWISSDTGKSYLLAETLLPGAAGASVTIMPEEQGDEGTISFELRVRGTKVALETTETFIAETDETTHIQIDDETAAENSLIGQ